MGIRVTKALGYGLADVQTTDGRIADLRINEDSPLLGGPGDVSSKGYLDFLRHTEDDDAALEAALVDWGQERGEGGQELCTWNGEYGLGGVLLVRPFGFSNWSRCGDAIDTEEENALRPDCDNRVTVLSSGIHPFSGLHMDARDGRRLDASLVSLWRKCEAGGLNRNGLDALASALGFQDAAQARECIVPLVPPEIRRVCDWGRLFTAPDVWLQLRPLLYTYWA